MQAAERFEKAIRDSAAALADGFQVADLSTLLKDAVELADTCDELSGSEKRALAIKYVEALIDRVSGDSVEQWVRDLDLPGPEWVEEKLWDPLLIKVAVPLVRRGLKSVVPSLIDLVVDATKGTLNVNRGEEA